MKKPFTDADFNIKKTLCTVNKHIKHQEFRRVRVLLWNSYALHHLHLAGGDSWPRPSRSVTAGDQSLMSCLLSYVNCCLSPVGRSERWEDDGIVQTLLRHSSPLQSPRTLLLFALFTLSSSFISSSSSLCSSLSASRITYRLPLVWIS